jgi:hypothetical protein
VSRSRRRGASDQPTYDLSDSSPNEWDSEYDKEDQSSCDQSVSSDSQFGASEQPAHDLSDSSPDESDSEDDNQNSKEDISICDIISNVSSLVISGAALEVENDIRSPKLLSSVERMDIIAENGNNIDTPVLPSFSGKVTFEQSYSDSKVSDDSRAATDEQVAESLSAPSLRTAPRDTDQLDTPVVIEEPISHQQNSSDLNLNTIVTIAEKKTPDTADLPVGEDQSRCPDTVDLPFRKRQLSSFVGSTRRSECPPKRFECADNAFSELASAARSNQRRSLPSLLRQESQFSGIYPATNNDQASAASTSGTSNTDQQSTSFDTDAFTRKRLLGSFKGSDRRQAVPEKKQTPESLLTPLFKTAKKNQLSGIYPATNRDLASAASTSGTSNTDQQSTSFDTDAFTRKRLLGSFKGSDRRQAVPEKRNSPESLLKPLSKTAKKNIEVLRRKEKTNWYRDVISPKAKEAAEKILQGIRKIMPDKSLTPKEKKMHERMEARAERDVAKEAVDAQIAIEKKRVEVKKAIMNRGKPRGRPRGRGRGVSRMDSNRSGRIDKPVRGAKRNYTKTSVEDAVLESETAINVCYLY